MNSLKKIIIDDSIKSVLSEFTVSGYLIKVESNTNFSTQVTNALDKLYQDIINLYKDVVITDIPKLKITRDGYKVLKKDPSHTRPASEALIRRIIKNGSLYRLGDIIDIGNIISCYTLKSVCVCDYDEIVGDILITKGNCNESFLGINRGMINACNLVVYKDDISIFGSTTSDTLRTSVKEKTKNILVMLISFNKTDLEKDETLLVNTYMELLNPLSIHKL